MIIEEQIKECSNKEQGCGFHERYATIPTMRIFQPGGANTAGPVAQNSFLSMS